MADNLIPRPGDILVLNGIGYCHFAIVSYDRCLIHVTSADKKSSLSSIFNSLKNKSSKAVVKEESRDEIDLLVEGFLRFAHVDNSLDNKLKPYSAEEIIKRARDKIGPWNYDLADNNCEHFAKWCRYGVDLCQQLVYKYDTGDSGGAGLGSLTVGPARLHYPSAHGKITNEKGRKELDLDYRLAGAEFGVVRANAGLNAKFGAHDEKDGIGFTAETKVAEAGIGPVKAKLGVGVSSGIQAGNGNYGAKVLGTGARVGKDGVAVSVLGSEVECCIM